MVKIQRFTMEHKKKHDQGQNSEKLYMYLLTIVLHSFHQGAVLGWS